ncbi:hypothetical protein SDC9_192010 [bioreactor metagenome]|uniref:Uncharacterized protein n=1 Tax=bioreactor metagenome TaxID=1076179 RepID=A0A645HZH8_9ZZZZ
MADGADSANPWSDPRHFSVGAALAELLEPAEFHDMKCRVGDLARVVEIDADFCVALNSGHRVDDNTLGHRSTC